MLRFRLRFFLMVVGLLGALAARAAAQPRPGSLRVTVRDATALPIAAAKVTVAGADRIPHESTTSERGIADIEDLPPGRYTVTIESPGFEPAALAEVAIRNGARTSRDVELKIAAILEEVNVLPPDADRLLTDAFTTTLTPEDIASLPEDPDELAEVLAQLAGLDAEIRVDGFADGALPPGTQIQSVRIRYDAASAGSSGGGPRIEIRTQPGGDRWRTNASFRVRDEGLNARNAFAPERPQGALHQFSWSFNGPIVKNKTGLSFTIDRTDSVEQQAIRAATPNGVFGALIHQPTDRMAVSGRLEHALTPDQRLRVEFRRSADTAANQGLGELDLPERAFIRENSDGEVRASHNATFRGQMVHDTRFQYRWRSGESTPASRATATKVAGAFSSGGAQVQGGRDTHEFEFEDELMFPVKKRHQVTTGVNIIGSHFSGDEWRNAGGTFSFADLDDFNAVLPTTYAQRVGDPRFAYSLYRFGAFVQEDFRVRKNLMLNLGVRHESQTHLSDWANFAPRLGANWTPSARLRTTLRGSYSVSFQPFQGTTYEQTVLVNGVRQRDVVISAPSYPDPFVNGIADAQGPPSIIRADPDIVMPSNRRASFGVEQPVGKSLRLRATYSRQAGHNLFRSVDANAPVDGVRPDPAARTITELQSTARSLNQSLELNTMFNYQPRRLSANATYTLGSQHNETDGQLTLPPDSFNLAQEWGPSRGDIRHRFDAAVNSELLLGLRISGNVHAQSASPYTITTGFDANGDGVANERPDGVGRNTSRGTGTKSLDLTLTYGFGFGHRAIPPPPRGRVGSVLNGVPPRPVPYVRFEIYGQAANIFNTVNYQNYSGVLTSPFFGRPTAASSPRRVSLGARMFF